MESLQEKLTTYRKTLAGVILGKPDILEFAVTTLLAGGHLLLEDAPGVGKTTLASAMSRGISGTFSRVQFTADLLPSDILGVRIFRRSEEKFEFLPGPVFANIVLADELNRAPPKTQSSLLQAMNENVVTIDRETFPLPSPFMVVATQNPRGFHGTYPLPESQRDRFMMRLSIGYPDSESEISLLRDRRHVDPIVHLQPVLSPEDILEAQKKARLIEVPDACLQYLNRLAEGTRTHGEVIVPASPRALVALMHAAQALAYLRGKTIVDIDLIKDLAPGVLGHRLGMRNLGQNHSGEGASGAWVTHELLQRIPVE